MLRDYHIYLKDHEIRSLALLQAVSGGALYTSETLHRLPADRLELFRFLEPPEEIKQASLPFLGRAEELVAYRQDLEGRHLVYLFNPTPKDITALYSLEELAGIKEGYVWKYKSDKQPFGSQAQIVEKIPSHSGLLLFVDSVRPIVAEPGNLWVW